MEHVTPIKAFNVRPGMRIHINAMYSMNLSLQDYRDKRIPMTIQVGHIKNLGTAVIIEALNHYQFEVPSGLTIGKVYTMPDDLNTLKPQFTASPTRVGHVSID